MYFILINNRFVSPQISHVYISFIYECSMEHGSHLERDDTLELGGWAVCTGMAALIMEQPFAPLCGTSFPFTEPWPGPVGDLCIRYHCNIAWQQQEGWCRVLEVSSTPCSSGQAAGQSHGPAPGAGRFSANSFDGGVRHQLLTTHNTTSSTLIHYTIHALCL